MRKLFAFIVLALAGAAGATVPSTTSEVSYSCNGTTTVHAVPFRFLEASHLVVKAGSSTLVITTDYTVQNTGTVSGGTVTLTAGSKCPAGSTLAITRTVPLTQGTSFRSQGSFSPATHENAFDKAMMAAQQVDRRVADAEATHAADKATQDSALAAETNARVVADSSLASINIAGAADPNLIAITATGSTTARTLAARFADVVNVRDFGALGDASTNDAAAFQAAHDALGPDGGTIEVPNVSSNYRIASGVVFTKPVRMRGAGWYPSEIVVTTGSLVVFATTKQLVVENMGFTATGAAAGTATFIKQLAASSGHNGTTIRNVYMQGAARGFWAERATEFHVVDSRISGGSYGLYLENLTNSDEGDSFINNTSFSDASVASIYVASTSGLYISNSKFNGPVPVHVDFAFTSNAIGDFTLSGGSIEGHTTAGVRIVGTTGVSTKTLITGVQFSSGGATHIVVGNKATNTAITGCTFNDVNAANGVGIDVQTGSQNTTIVGNAFHAILTAIQAGANVVGIDLYGNRFAGDVTTYFAGESTQTALGSVKDLTASRFIQNASDSVYVDAFKFTGNCVADIQMSGTVQGVAATYKYTKKLISGGTTITDAIALISVGGAFDVQIAASGGYVVVSVKRAAATGTSITLNVTVTLSGYVTEFLKG